MQRGVVADVVVVNRLPVLKLLSAEYDPLLFRGYPLLLGDLRLHLLDGLPLLDLDGHGLACEGLDEELHPTAQFKGGRER